MLPPPLASDSLTGTPQAEKELPSILRGFWIAIVAFTAFAYFATFFFVHGLHRTQYPFSDTLLPPNYLGIDFLCFSDRFQHFHQPAFFGPYQQAFNYPAPVALIYAFFYKLTPFPEETYLAVASLSYLIAAILFARALIRRHIRPLTAITFTATTLFFSYPLLLAAYLAQMEIAVWAFTSLGLFAYLRGKGYTSAACFGIAASMKYYPILYLGLAFARRQYRQAAFGLLTCASTLLVSLQILGPNAPAAWHSLKQEMIPFKVFYLYSFHHLENGIDHSLFGLIKNLLYHLHSLGLLPRLVLPYLAVVALSGLLIYLLRIIHLPLNNQVLALTVAAVLLPPISHDYTLVHMYAPWAMLTFFLVDGGNLPQFRKPQFWTFLCFVILFVPGNYIFYRDIRMGGQLKAVILLVLFFISLRYPFERQQHDTQPRELQVPRTAAIP